MTTAQQDRVDRIERGRDAEALLALIEDRLTEQRDRIIARLMSRYRSGELTHDQMVGGLGEIASLYELSAALQSEARQGITASQQEYANGTEANTH